MNLNVYTLFAFTFAVSSSMRSMPIILLLIFSFVEKTTPSHQPFFGRKVPIQITVCQFVCTSVVRTLNWPIVIIVGTSYVHTLITDRRHARGMKNAHKHSKTALIKICKNVARENVVRHQVKYQEFTQMYSLYREFLFFCRKLLMSPSDNSCFVFRKYYPIPSGETSKESLKKW